MTNILRVIFGLGKIPGPGIIPGLRKISSSSKIPGPSKMSSAGKMLSPYKIPVPAFVHCQGRGLGLSPSRKSDPGRSTMRSSQTHTGRAQEWDGPYMHVMGQIIFLILNYT